MTPEQLAQRFHETYERLAPDFGYKTREASAKPWAEVPDNNKRLMIAVCAEIRSDVSYIHEAYRLGVERGQQVPVTDAERKQALEALNNKTEIGGVTPQTIGYERYRVVLNGFQLETIRRALTVPVVQVTDLEALSIKTALDLKINRLDVARVINHIASEYHLTKKVK